MEVILNRNYPRSNLVYFAVLRQFKTLCIPSEYIYISFQICKALFETSCITSGSRIEP
jgi:hypothetical protein